MNNNKKGERFLTLDLWLARLREPELQCSRCTAARWKRHSSRLIRPVEQPVRNRASFCSADPSRMPEDTSKANGFEIWSEAR